MITQTQESCLQLELATLQNLRATLDGVYKQNIINVDVEIFESVGALRVWEML